MTRRADIDSALVQWCDRLFYPSNRVVKSSTPWLQVFARGHADSVRRRIAATVARRAPQVMVKVTGGGRAMAAIAAHFRYISKSGRLPIEDERGIVREGRDALRDVADQWRYGGSFIDEVGHRRKAFNIMLSMPQGTDPIVVQRAAREFAQAELHGHAYVMALHEHQANPHVHLSVRAESAEGNRLNPRKADLHRWRETFAEKLRGWGIEAEATHQATHGANRVAEPLWRLKAAEAGRLDCLGSKSRSGDRHERSRTGAILAWAHIAQALEKSEAPEDLALARRVRDFVKSSPAFQELRQRYPGAPQRSNLGRTVRPPEPTRVRPSPEIER